MSRTLRINTPRVFVPFLQPSRYKGSYGGRGSAKSHFFAELLLDYCISRPGTRAVCVREVQQSLEQSVKRLLEDKIETFKVQPHFRVMNTHIDTPGEGIIIFQGMSTQTRESIKSLEGYHIAWVEEAQSLSQRSLDLLRPTIRQEGSELWFSWNPRNPTDPVDALLRSKNPPPSSIVIRSMFRDNPWFPDVLRQEMLWDKQTDPEKYAHIWLGEYERHVEARVFKNWRVEEFDSPEGVVFYFGGDWGFSEDPTVLVRLFLKNEGEIFNGRELKRKTLCIDYEAYQIGCEIDHTPSLFEKIPGSKTWTIVADSARPETISYLRRNGYPRIQPAVKGPDSLKEGIILLQGYDIVIHPRCVHTIDEFTMYSYKKDPLTDMVTPILEDKKNHVIDSVRYAVEPIRVPAARVVRARGY